MIIYRLANSIINNFFCMFYPFIDGFNCDNFTRITLDFFSVGNILFIAFNVLFLRSDSLFGIFDSTITKCLVFRFCVFCCLSCYFCTFCIVFWFFKFIKTFFPCIPHSISSFCKCSTRWAIDIWLSKERNISMHIVNRFLQCFSIFFCLVWFIIKTFRSCFCSFRFTFHLFRKCKFFSNVTAVEKS